MRAAAAGQLPGVTAIGVTVDDAARSVRHIESAGYRVQRAADGTVVLPAGDLNGVTLELRQADADARPSSPGAWRRINGWFGLTAAGTDAGALRRFLDRRGEGVYALGVIVDDWAGTVKSLRRNGARLLTSEASSQTFVHPATTHGVLIEVVAERPRT